MAQRSSTGAHLRGVLITLPWVLYLLVADVLLSLLLPLALFAPSAVYEASSQIASSVWAWIQLIFESFNGAHIEVSGDPLPKGESAIVVANHVAWCDFYMIQALAQRAGMLKYCRYFAKSQLKAVPFLGWGLWAMGMPLVSRNWLKDKAELDRVFSGIVKGGYPTWLVSYSEATRFTLKKFEESQTWCKKSDKQQPKNLLFPRTKGFVTTVQHLRKTPHVKAVYDLTIAYQHDGVFHEAPPMWDTLSTPGLSSSSKFKFHVHARRFPLKSLPDSDEDLARWLEERWIEKGEWLESRKQVWAVGTSST
ncbi:hypothetical protein E4U24_000134 [Claviceps purpurea]|nr:hypothetical protein E4U12_000947 [Claviceps purpurea]KAG6142315.1 hypothetical protein E4U28_002721 [Claviceps purpurea]KAG6144839.1 hypothetical protein E4U38_001569 [Claviceps purpurea]KAG6165716.1 hypothetical protein E4U11_000175 [Claviceps purpurea]KAG6172990.1 hypothetical protein E4U27_006908 [Claviceps purpurea]